MANKRKTTTAIVAGVTAVALLLGGTFAWTSISQQAKNEAAGVVNVGGRLHDDFNGENKDVYVENFTDPYDGGQPIYARVRLDEYMEVGKEAGGNDADGNGTVDAVPVINDTSRDDVTTWKPHVPAGACEKCESGDTCAIHDHWTWTMGGQTTFMPTFNKDKDSLDADINGTYHGTDATDKVYYDDYVEYTTNPDDPDNKKVYSKEDTAYYDNDPDTEVNDHETLEGVRTETETHTAKNTANGTVILMSEWLQNPVPGNFWVYDTDGWAYWANPIMPGEATGLLLDSIVMEKNPGEKCYYAINVVAQFSTVNDWEEFYTDENTKTPDISDDARAVLTAAAGNVTTVTVTNLGSATLYIDPEEGQTNTTTFTATASKAGTSAADTSTFEWVVYDEDFNVIDTPIPDENGVITVLVDDTITSESLIIAAKDTASGAVGLSAVAIAPTAYTVNITAASNTVDVGYTLDLSAAVTKNGEADTTGVIWSVDSTAGSTITDGVLTVSANEAHGTELTVTATSVADSRAVGIYTVSVYNGYELLKTAEAGTTNTIRIDNMEWYVLVQDAEENKALIWAADVIPDKSMRFDTGDDAAPLWESSDVRTYLNGEYYNSLNVLKEHAALTTISTANNYNRNATDFAYIETGDKVFLLSEADVFGTANNASTTNTGEFTYYGMDKIILDAMKKCSKPSWLRSPRTGSSYMAQLISGGSCGTYQYNNPSFLRPAMWVNLGE